MAYSKDYIESILYDNICYNKQGKITLNNIIEIRVTTFREALKVSKHFKDFLTKNGDYYYLYSFNYKKLVGLHKLDLRTLSLHEDKTQRKF